jgi:transposase
MAQFREYGPAGPLLIGYDPYRDLPDNHLARLIDRVVDEAIKPGPRSPGKGQPAFDPRLCIKVLVYSYSIGVRSSRHMERMCRESLPVLYLTRGDGPSYRTLCSARINAQQDIELVWQALFAVGREAGMVRLGRLVLDTTKIRANASPDSVLRQKEYDAVREELKRILAENETLDTKEDTDGSSIETNLPKPVSGDHMREHIRRVRSQMREQTTEAQESKDGVQEPVAGDDEDGSSGSDSSPDATSDGTPALTEPVTALTPAMQKQIVQAIAAIDAAEADGRKHLCLTDPDARMMPEGRSKRLRECHAFEVAVDKDAGGLIVAAGVTTESDNLRTLPLVEAAREQEPDGIRSVDGDSGMWRGDDIAYLEGLGIETCIPDSNTACDLHRGQLVGTTRSKRTGTTKFTYDPVEDCYWCPQGCRLSFVAERKDRGQTVRVYRANQVCSECSLPATPRSKTGPKPRCLKVGVQHEAVSTVLARFNDPEHRGRYRNRAKEVETIFAFIRSVLGFTFWLLRGTERVDCEATLFKTAYQIRKVHTALTWGT